MKKVERFLIVGKFSIGNKCFGVVGELDRISSHFPGSIKMGTVQDAEITLYTIINYMPSYLEYYRNIFDYQYEDISYEPIKKHNVFIKVKNFLTNKFKSILNLKSLLRS